MLQVVDAHSIDLGHGLCVRIGETLANLVTEHWRRDDDNSLAREAGIVAIAGNAGFPGKSSSVNLPNPLDQRSWTFPGRTLRWPP